MMSTEQTNIQDEIDNRKLARAYVVLAMARDAASNYISEKPANADLHPLLTMLDMSHALLEEILEHSMPVDVPTATADNLVCSDLLM